MKSKTCIFIQTLLFLIIFGMSSLTVVIDSESDTLLVKSKQAQTWIQPDPDNEYYSEYLDVTVYKDGSILKEWNLVDHGIDDISFPINLTIPVNSSTLALEDLRIRLAVVQNDGFSQEWGPITYRDTSYEFQYDDEIESLVSHVFLEFYVLMNDSNDDTLIVPFLDEMILELENLWEGVQFLKFEENFAIAGRRITQTWRAFPTEDQLDLIFENLIGNNLPTEYGLFGIDDTERFVNSNQKSIHLVANWDGMNESGADTFDQEPYIDGVTENFDERWEYIAGISCLESQYLNIDYNTLNNLKFSDLISYSGGLDSHPKANSSILDVNLYYGSEIIIARPKFEDSPRYKSRYVLDMLTDSGEGSDFILPDYSHINFTDGFSKVPVMTTKVISDKYNIKQGENFTLTYEISNIGEVPAYDITLEDDFNYGFPENYSIMMGDPDDDNIVEESWNLIENGSTEFFSIDVYCNTTAENGSFLWADPELEYHASNYAEENLWERNPRDYGGGYQIDGSEIIVLCNVTSPLLQVQYTIPETIFTVGDHIKVGMNITNVGNNATEFDWRFPIIGLNTSSINGHVNFLDSGSSINIESSFIVDYPERFSGDYIESRFFYPALDASVDYQFTSIRGAFIRDQYANEIPINVFPKTEKSFGALVQLSKSIIDLEIEGENTYQVTITTKNVGNTPAFDVDILDNYPIENFTIISGSNSINWDLLLPGMQFSYSYIVKYPEATDLTLEVSYLVANYDLAYNWFSGSCWAGTYNSNSRTSGSPGSIDIFPFIIGIGFIGSTAAAIALGVLLFREKRGY